MSNSNLSLKMEGCRMKYGGCCMLLPPIKFAWTTCSCPNRFAGFLARDCYEGIQTCDLWVSVLIWSYRRAMVGGTPEFPGQLIASLLVAQWSERWCTNLVAQGSIHGMSCSESPITRGETQMMLLPPTSFLWTTSYPKCLSCGYFLQ